MAMIAAPSIHDADIVSLVRSDQTPGAVSQSRLRLDAFPPIDTQGDHTLAERLLPALTRGEAIHLSALPDGATSSVIPLGADGAPAAPLEPVPTDIPRGFPLSQPNQPALIAPPLSLRSIKTSVERWLSLTMLWVLRVIRPPDPMASPHTPCGRALLLPI